MWPILNAMSSSCDHEGDVLMCYGELPSRKKDKNLHTDNHAANWFCGQLQSVCTVTHSVYY